MEEGTLDDVFLIFAGEDDSDLGYAVAEEMGLENIANLEFYFDYEGYGRDLSLGGIEQEYRDEDPQYAEYLDDLSELELGEHFVNEVYGGIENLSRELLMIYFDYEEYGRTLAFDYSYADIADGVWILQL
jgi:antirestriction protein